MSRLIFLVAVAALIYLLFKSLRSPAKKPQQQAAEDMVRCAHCGVHLPAGESVRDDDAVFCSAAHRDAYRAEHA